MNFDQIVILIPFLVINFDEILNTRSKSMTIYKNNLRGKIQGKEKKKKTT